MLLSAYDCIRFHKTWQLVTGISKAKPICDQAIAWVHVNTIITTCTICPFVLMCCYGHGQLWDNVFLFLFSLLFRRRGARCSIISWWYPCDSRYMSDDNNYRMCSLVAPWEAGSSPNARLYMLVATTTLSNQLCGCGLLTSVFVLYKRARPGQLCLYLLGGYCHTAWLAVRLWFTNLCAGYWIDSGWCSYAQLCLNLSVTATMQSGKMCGCGVLTGSVLDFSGIPGVTVWSYLCACTC